jgi:predicted XRE-type DNA-binding protein
MNNFDRGRISKLSLGALLNIVTRADLAVRVEVARPAA